MTERKHEDIDPIRKKKIIGRVKDVFKAYDFLKNTIFDFIRDQQVVYDSSNKDLAISYLYSKALKTFYAIYELCKEGYAGDAFVLFRTLMEIRINILYLWHSDKSVAERFLEFEDYVKYDYFIKQKGKPFESKDIIEKIDMEYLEQKSIDFRNKYENVKPHFWSGLPIRLMIDKLPSDIRENEIEYYETVYRQCSFHVHSNILSLKDKISEDGIFRISPNLDNIEIVFPMTVLYVLEIIKLWNEYMQVQLPTDLNDKIADLQNYAYIKFND